MTHFKKPFLWGRLALTTLGTHRLCDGGSFPNRFVRDGIGQRREQQRNVVMADDFAELPFCNQQPRPNPAFDLIACPPTLDVAANRLHDGEGDSITLVQHRVRRG